jgi:FAD synthetase
MKPRRKWTRWNQLEDDKKLTASADTFRKHRPEQLSISYNGGKDCLVLLILILACLPAWTGQTAPSEASASLPNPTSDADPPPLLPESQPPKRIPTTIQAVYVVSKYPFPEVESFVESSAGQYHLDLSRYALPMRPALDAYLGEKKDVKAIFVGTRRTDPHGEFLTHFDPTDKGWPPFMRVHPVIDWHYAEIWAVSAF